MVVGLAIAALAAAAPAAQGDAQPVARCKPGLHFMSGHCMTMPAGLIAKAKPKTRPKRTPKLPLAAAVVPPPVAPAPPVVPPPAPVCQDSALSAFVTPFLVHLSAAHLQESPLQQVHDLLNTDQYVLVHTELIGNMLAGLLPVLRDLLDGDLNGAVAGLLTRTCASGPPAVSAPAAVVSVAPPPVVSAAAAPPPAPPAPMPMPMPMPVAQPMPPAAPSATVDMTGTAFVPAEITVRAGGSVTWHNGDPVPHTITSVGSGPLASPIVAAGGDFSFTFPNPGTYTYYCLVHPNMRASVVVR